MAQNDQIQLFEKNTATGEAGGRVFFICAISCQFCDFIPAFADILWANGRWRV